MTPCYLSCACKWNKINFVLSVKLFAKMNFLQYPLKAYIFYPNRFLYVLPKTPRNKLLLAIHDYYFMIEMFLSCRWIIKDFFSRSILLTLVYLNWFEYCVIIIFIVRIVRERQEIVENWYCYVSMSTRAFPFRSTLNSIFATVISQ